jgi:cytosine/uracil/thiamine/allantoin permease
MTFESEGMRRLAIVCGVIAAVGWLIFWLISIAIGFTRVQPVGWGIIVLGIPVSLAVGFIVVWAIDWVLAGFHSRRL